MGEVKYHLERFVITVVLALISALMFVLTIILFEAESILLKLTGCFTFGIAVFIVSVELAIALIGDKDKDDK